MAAMGHHEKFFNFEMVRVLTASALGSSVTLADVDIMIKILIGIATLAYVTKKAADRWRGLEK